MPLKIGYNTIKLCFGKRIKGVYFAIQTEKFGYGFVGLGD